MSRYRDDAGQLLPVRLDPDAPDALAVIRPMVPGWSTVTTCRLTPIGGGITNRLLRVDADGVQPVLVRIYGPNTEVVIDRDAENRLFARLSRAGFAPPYLGRFLNGRVEGFLQGFRPLQPDELGREDLRQPIAARLAELHAFPLDDPHPRTWPTLQGWMDTARSVRFEGQDAARHAALDLDRRAAELEALRRELDALVRAPPRPGTAAALRPVLAHNDLLSGNVLLHESTGEVRFIDFEYGATGYAAFDIANHFCEYAGFDSDYARGFPDRAARIAFVAAYLGARADDRRTVDFCDVVDFFVLVDHFWWGSWAVVQARHSPIAFDFMEYARLRFAGFDVHCRGV
jgi:ethanolamine kinase